MDLLFRLNSEPLVQAIRETMGFTLPQNKKEIFISETEIISKLPEEVLAAKSQEKLPDDQAFLFFDKDFTNRNSVSRESSFVGEFLAFDKEKSEFPDDCLEEKIKHKSWHKNDFKEEKCKEDYDKCDKENCSINRPPLPHSEDHCKHRWAPEDPCTRIGLKKKRRNRCVPCAEKKPTTKTSSLNAIEVPLELVGVAANESSVSLGGTREYSKKAKEDNICQDKSADMALKRRMKEFEKNSVKPDPCKCPKFPFICPQKCEEKKDSCEKKNPCEKKDPCEKKEDPCKKQEDPCKKEDVCEDPSSEKVVLRVVRKPCDDLKETEAEECVEERSAKKERAPSPFDPICDQKQQTVCEPKKPEVVLAKGKCDKPNVEEKQGTCNAPKKEEVKELKKVASEKICASKKSDGDICSRPEKGKIYLVFLLLI